MATTSLSHSKCTRHHIIWRIQNGPSCKLTICIISAELYIKWNDFVRKDRTMQTTGLVIVKRRNLHQFGHVACLTLSVPASDALFESCAARDGIPPGLNSHSEGCPLPAWIYQIFSNTGLSSRRIQLSNGSIHMARSWNGQKAKQLTMTMMTVTIIIQLNNHMIWKVNMLTLVTCIALILPVWRTCGPRHKSISGPHLHR